MSRPEYLNKPVGSLADSLVNKMTAEDRSGSCRTENASLCILVCYTRQLKHVHPFGRVYTPHIL